MVTFSARPSMPLKHHLPAAQPDEASIERRLLVLVPIDIGIRGALPWMRSPICYAVNFPARFEIVVSHEILWTLKRSGRLDDQARQCLSFTFNSQIETGLPLRSFPQ